MKAQIDQTLMQESSLYIALKPGAPCWILAFETKNLYFHVICLKMFLPYMSETICSLPTQENDQTASRKCLLKKESHIALLVNRREFLNSLRNYYDVAITSN